ncbi:hypothetical protein BU16DRAFT_528173 [Lophium mytilinum]|uniref:Uncharacterized protein n=1 Tax=Lophium mytilinum TaxID=390894 RepID=A0A6A6QPD7_9PEZI|nr:hypothetical protein BU16DRAFT_528173 [Lophium mytilinum]
MLKVGEQVFGLAYGEAYMEYITIYTRRPVHKPNGFSRKDCADMLETWITATQSLYPTRYYNSGFISTLLRRSGLVNGPKQLTASGSILHVLVISLNLCS